MQEVPHSAVSLSKPRKCGPGIWEFWKKPQRWSNKLSSFILQRLGRKLIISAKSGVKEQLLFPNHDIPAEICLQRYSAEKHHMRSLVIQNQPFSYSLAYVSFFQLKINCVGFFLV